jgi:hypothetical protein
MIAVLQAVFVVVLNLVPAGGVVLRGWSPATALTLYWGENLVGSVLIALRIALHRRMTRKRGHYRGQIDVKDGTTGRVRSRPSTFLAEFTTVGLAFCLVHGVFLAALLAIVVKESPSPAELRQGLPWMLGAQLGWFLLDLPYLRNWSFAELKRLADRLIGRIGLIHFALMGGMLIAAFSSRPRAFFAAFGTLKALADLGSLLPAGSGPPAEAPRWFLWTTRRLGQDRHRKTRQDVATWWRDTTRAERQRVEEDEQVV